MRFMTSSNHTLELPDRSVRALVLDAHAPTRIGLGVLLRHQPWIARCLLAAEHQESLALARRHRPDVAILDISDAGPFASSITAQIRDAHPAVQIVLSSRCSKSLGVQPLAVGATAFLAPGSSGENIVETIRAAVLSNEAPAPPAPRTADSHLSEREREILGLLSTGATNREIALRLHLGPDSIKKHATALYRKLGVRNRTEAAQRAASVLGAPW